jgi:hypothetical protein
LLGEADRGPAGEARVVFNDPSLQVRRQVGAGQFDAERWAAIQQQMDERGRGQRGIRRAKDPAKYPLACRLIDLTGGCGSVLYGRTASGRLVYTCGRYMRSDGSECASNQVDAEAMLRFTLTTLRQLTEWHGNRERLRQKLLERARREGAAQAADPVGRELADLRARLGEADDALEAAKRRMAREKDDARYEALASEFDRLSAERQRLVKAIGGCEARLASVATATPEEAVEGALGLLDDVTRVASAPGARAEVNPLLQRLGIWIGLTFGTVVKGEKRRVQKLLSGRMTFGDAPLPVPLFGEGHVGGGPHGGGCASPLAPQAGGEGPGIKCDVFREGGAESETAEGEESSLPSAAPGPCDPARPMISQPEGISITKVSRGDRRRTFPNEPSGQLLLRQACAQALEFAADSFFQLRGGQ